MYNTIINPQTNRKVNIYGKPTFLNLWVYAMLLEMANKLRIGWATNVLLRVTIQKVVVFPSHHTATISKMKFWPSQGLLICTLISENQGLLQTLEKFQVLQTWIFFQGLHLEKKLDLYHKPEKNPGDKLKKNPGVQDLKFF